MFAVLYQPVERLDHSEAAEDACFGAGSCPRALTLSIPQRKDDASAPVPRQEGPRLHGRKVASGRLCRGRHPCLGVELGGEEYEAHEQLRDPGSLSDL